MQEVVLDALFMGQIIRSHNGCPKPGGCCVEPRGHNFARGALGLRPDIPQRRAKRIWVGFSRSAKEILQFMNHLEVPNDRIPQHGWKRGGATNKVGLQRNAALDENSEGLCAKSDTLANM